MIAIIMNVRVKPGKAEQFKALGVRVKDDIPGTILAKSDITDSLEVIQEG